MIAGLFLMMAIAQGGAAAVTYVNVPPEAERVVLYRWRPGAAPVVLDARLDGAGSAWTVVSAAGTDVIAVFVRRDEAYVIDGPFRWPASGSSRVLDRRWRRSVRVAMLDGTPRDGEIEWISADGTRDAWPSCIRDGPVAAVCWGVPLTGAGIVYVQAPRQLSWAVVSGATPGAMHVSEWARLLVVHAAAPKGLRAAIEYPVQPTQRTRSVRLQTARVPESGALTVGTAGIWAYGAAVPPRAWIDVRAERAGPIFLPLADIAAAPPSLAVQVVLDETRSIEGVVIDAAAAPAPGSLATVFRLLAPAQRTSPGPGAEPPPRVFVAEAITDREGRFAIDGLGAGDYEIVAWHPQRGRASLPLDGRTPVEIRLETAGTIRGRALSAGKPASGVDVISVPDPAAARHARDLLDLAGGNVRTGPDGRFVVSAAPAGGGALRIGGGAYPIRRIPLPRESAGTIDLGDVELGAAIAITVSLDTDPGCDLRAAGPVGASGLLIVAAARAGPGLFRIEIPEEGAWEFTLSCGGVERALSPAVRQITSALAGKEVQFVVRDR